MGFKSPSHNDDTFNTRFKPYARASPRAIRPLAARDIEDLELGIELSLRSYYFELERRDYVEPNNYLYVVLTERYQETRMGSAMELDRPITFSGTYGCLDTIMADDETGPLAVVPSGSQAHIQSGENHSPKRERLVRGLQKTADKYLLRHFQANDPHTEELRERINIALRAAMLGADVDNMVPRPKTAHHTKSKEGEPAIIQTTDEYIIPPAMARCIVNCVAKGLQSLRNTLSIKSQVLDFGEVYPDTMPGGLDVIQ
ncbi:hypothetical protein EV424DRAFT_1546940 [Suillus variegatus]|nr:hypothetical protein EV424DRAFT_1546940 [Suillus variegatus]